MGETSENVQYPLPRRIPQRETVLVAHVNIASGSDELRRKVYVIICQIFTFSNYAALSIARQSLHEMSYNQHSKPSISLPKYLVVHQSSVLKKLASPGFLVNERDV